MQDITYKTTNATLRGGDYEQFVYYWMPFFGNYGMQEGDGTPTITRETQFATTIEYSLEYLFN